MSFCTLELDFFFSEQILDNRCAYVVGGDVYFSVDNFPEYGELSGRKLDDNRAGERVAVDERKRNPADFALWKVQDVPNLIMQHFFVFYSCGNDFVQQQLVYFTLTAGCKRWGAMVG
jgi:hypothetical protein